MRFSRAYFYGAFLCGAAAWLSFSPAAHADVKEISARLKTCRAIESMVDRIQCYDEAVDDFNLDTLDKLTVGEGSSGKWKASFEQSPLNGQENVYLSLTADGYVRNPAGDYIRPNLVIRCMNGKMGGYIDWSSVLGRENTLVVSSRAGKQTTVDANWALSADYKATFLPDVAGLVAELLPEDNYYVKAWPDQGDPMEASFDIRGLKTAIQPLAKACKLGLKIPEKTAAKATP